VRRRQFFGQPLHVLELDEPGVPCLEWSGALAEVNSLAQQRVCESVSLVNLVSVKLSRHVPLHGARGSAGLLIET
jgi:hypothetical protein